MASGSTLTRRPGLLARYWTDAGYPLARPPLAQTGEDTIAVAPLAPGLAPGEGFSSIPSRLLSLPFEAGALTIEPREVLLPLRIARCDGDQPRHYLAAFAQLDQGFGDIAKL